MRAPSLPLGGALPAGALPAVGVALYRHLFKEEAAFYSPSLWLLASILDSVAELAGGKELLRRRPTSTVARQRGKVKPCPLIVYQQPRVSGRGPAVLAPLEFGAFAEALALFMLDHFEGKAKEEIKFRPSAERRDPVQVLAILKVLYGCAQSDQFVEHVLDSSLRQEQLNRLTQTVASLQAPRSQGASSLEILLESVRVSELRFDALLIQQLGRTHAPLHRPISPGNRKTEDH
ncbi:unnamed protein product [Pleuronectes platessa]|uniref:Uncharacterized protein n=1 Tax=Pleuronectes platessa TaxID=8262 RepID=A0A9N7ZFB2_PLEPL|nr:unnamed protein product [Pleuronectes platessa]